VLARAGFGTQLIQGIQNHPNDNMAFLDAWHAALCEELRTNTSGQLLKCLPKLASLVPMDFPDMAVLQLYLAPCMTDYMTHPAVFVPVCRVDFVLLMLFCEWNFQWADAGAILRYFASYVFPGHAVRQLIKAAMAMDSGLVPDSSIFSYAVCENQYDDAQLPEIHVTLKVKLTIYEILAAIQGKYDTLKTMAKVHEWVEDGFHVCATLPLVLIEHVLPQCVEEFRSRKKGRFPRSFLLIIGACSYAFSQVPL
jgi:hypothetical protein